MPSVLVVVFLVEVAARLVNAIGAAAINNFVRQPCHLPGTYHRLTCCTALDGHQLPADLDVEGCSPAAQASGRVPQGAGGPERD